MGTDRIMSSTAILIGGCERSGTTMLGSLIGGHKKVITIPASQFISDATAGLEHEQIDNSLELLRERIAAHYQFISWGIELPKASEHHTYRSFIEDMIARYARTQNKDGFDHWCSHSPSNIAHAHLMLRLFPDAKFVHIVRDGRAVAASFRKLPWRIFSMQRLASIWMQRVSHGLALETHNPDKTIRVHYENIIKSSEPEIQRICEFLGLEFSANMLTGEGFSHSEGLVGKPPQKKRIDAWQQELSAKDIEAFEFFSKDFLLSLGYTKHTPHEPRPISEKQKVIMLLQDAIKFTYDTVNKKLNG